MTKGRDRGHRVVGLHFCKNLDKTRTGGVGFVRVLLGDW